jgi:hypothetical protein
MKKLVIIIICLLLTSCAGTWDKKNTELHVPLTAIMLVDYGQTLYNVENRYSKCQNEITCHTETNTILGKFPNRQSVQNYFAISYALTTFAVYALPEKWSHGFQVGVITIESYVTLNNYYLGAGVKF